MRSLLFPLLLSCTEESTPAEDPIRAPIKIRDCPLPESREVVQLSTDGSTVIALRADGTTFCMGGDRFGECGLKSAGLPLPGPLNTEVPRCASSVFVGGGVSAALSPSGALSMWGTEGDHEFGDGPGFTASYGVAVDLVGLPPIAQIAVGGSTTAITRDGNVYWWGAHSAEVGGPETETHETPFKVDLPRPAIAAATSAINQYVLLDDGVVLARGINENGSIGDGTLEFRPDFVQVGLPEPAIAIARGVPEFARMCAALESRRVACWGEDHFGMSVDSSPVVLPGITDVDEVRFMGAVIGRGGCAFKRGGPAYCWDQVFSPFLETPSLEPQKFGAYDDILDLAITIDGGCILRSDHEVYCTGDISRIDFDAGFTGGFRKMPNPEPTPYGE